MKATDEGRKREAGPPRSARLWREREPHSVANLVEIQLSSRERRASALILGGSGGR